MMNKSYSISSMPNYKLAGVLARRNKPMVMANFLKFKDQATGRYRGMSGQEAYAIYAESAMTAQGPMGSRVIWAGQVEELIAGSHPPEFSSIVFLEYASPRSFLKFVIQSKSDGKARSAGLEGQWLLASSTLEEACVAKEGEVALVEVFSGASLKRNKAPDWLGSWQTIKADSGGEVIWVGAPDSQPMGSSNPMPSKIIITRFPDKESLDQSIRTREAEAIKNYDVDDLKDYIAFRASTSTEFAELLESNR